MFWVGKEMVDCRVASPRSAFLDVPSSTLLNLGHVELQEAVEPLQKLLTASSHKTSALHFFAPKVRRDPTMSHSSLVLHMDTARDSRRSTLACIEERLKRRMPADRDSPILLYLMLSVDRSGRGCLPGFQVGRRENVDCVGRERGLVWVSQKKTWTETRSVDGTKANRRDGKKSVVFWV